MNALVLIVITVLVLALAAITTLAMVIVGIHGEERRKSIASPPRTCTGTLARRVMGVRADPARNPHRTRADARRYPMPTLQHCLPENNCCPCGVALDRGKRRCRKCRARSRWYRRQAHRTRPVSSRRSGPRTVRGGR